MRMEDNKAHWEKWAQEHKEDLRATTKGKTQKDLELFYLTNALLSAPDSKKHKRILECGCGNGFNLFRIAEVFLNYSCVGFDYVDEMIENAKINLSKIRTKSGVDAQLDFKVGDLRKVRDFGTGWDVIFTVRSLINLASFQEQLNAVTQMTDMLNSGGLLILIENGQSSYKAQNQLREAAGLASRTPAAFNVFTQEQDLIDHAKDLGLKMNAFKNIGSLHDILLYVLLPKIHGEVNYQHPLVHEAKDLEINQACSIGDKLGGYGQVNMFVFQK